MKRYKHAGVAFLAVYLEFLELTGLKAGRRSHFYLLTTGFNYYMVIFIPSLNGGNFFTYCLQFFVVQSYLIDTIKMPKA